MPLRMIIDSGAVQPDDVALVGARNLDPPEEEFIAATGVHRGERAVERALADAGTVYVAIDADAIDAAEISAFAPEPDGISLADAQALLRNVRQLSEVVGAGFSGLVPDAANLEPLRRLADALGL
jgi:arginase family enzyme